MNKEFEFPSNTNSNEDSPKKKNDSDNSRLSSSSSEEEEDRKSNDCSRKESDSSSSSSEIVKEQVGRKSNKKKLTYLVDQEFIQQPRIVKTLKNKLMQSYFYLKEVRDSNSFFFYELFSKFVFRILILGKKTWKRFISFYLIDTIHHCHLCICLLYFLC